MPTHKPIPEATWQSLAALDGACAISMRREDQWLLHATGGRMVWSGIGGPPAKHRRAWHVRVELRHIKPGSGYGLGGIVDRVEPYLADALAEASTLVISTVRVTTQIAEPNRPTSVLHRFLGFDASSHAKRYAVRMAKRPRSAARQAKAIIEDGGWVSCWICEEVFRRKRETRRYCAKCGRGFCEGEHGNFAYNLGTCVVCGARKQDRPAAHR